MSYNTLVNQSNNYNKIKIDLVFKFRNKKVFVVFVYNMFYWYKKRNTWQSKQFVVNDIGTLASGFTYHDDDIKTNELRLKT